MELSLDVAFNLAKKKNKEENSGDCAFPFSFRYLNETYFVPSLYECLKVAATYEVEALIEEYCRGLELPYIVTLAKVIDPSYQLKANTAPEAFVEVLSYSRDKVLLNEAPTSVVAEAILTCLAECNYAVGRVGNSDFVSYAKAIYFVRLPLESGQDYYISGPFATKSDTSLTDILIPFLITYFSKQVSSAINP